MGACPRSPAAQPPADDVGLQRVAGFVIAPGAIAEAAGERQFVGAALVFAQHLDRQIRRRLSLTIELCQPFFACRHVQSSDSEVRMISLRPLMRTSESKELWQSTDSSAALNLKF